MAPPGYPKMQETPRRSRHFQTISAPERICGGLSGLSGVWSEHWAWEQPYEYQCTGGF